MNKLILTSLASAVLLSSCSTLSSVGDAINPFDKSESQKKIDQGDVADESNRISILELSETLTVDETSAPDQITLPPAYVNTDWPQMGGNPQHVVQHTGASGQLVKVWSTDIGKGSGGKSRVAASPVIANGTIYTMDGSNGVMAIDEATGGKRWQQKIKVEVREKTRKGKVSIVDRIRNPLSFTEGSGRDKESIGGGVTFGEGKLFVSSGLGIMTALDPESGAPLWATPTRTPLHSAPVVSDGRVFAVSDDNELFAFNANTGEVIWTYQAIIENARMLTVPSPAIIDDVVITPFSSGEIVALRVQNGGVLWQDALSSSTLMTPLASLNDIASGPVIADGYVIATAQSGVMTALDLRTGQRIWSQPAGSLGFPLVAGDFVYTVTTDGKVVCLSKLNGSVLWIQQLPAYQNAKKRKKRIVWSGPIFVGDRLFVTSSRGRSVILNPYSGAIISENKLADSVFVAPIIANETVYIVTDDAKLIALR